MHSDVTGFQIPSYNFDKTRRIIFSVFVFILTFPFLSNGQVKNSVYSMFGVGQIIDNSFGINKALGGTGIAFQSGTDINYLNPASYLGIPTSSYVMELGVYGIYNRSETNKISQTDSYVNLNYFSASFYFTKWWASSFGIVPFSSVDYEFKTENEIGGELTTYEKTFSGSGGLNKIYMGHSFRIFGGLSVGLNSSYIVGPITQTETAASSSDFAGYELENKRTAHGFYMDYGIQYSLPDNDWLYTVGLVYGASKKLSTTDDLTFTYNDESTSLDHSKASDIKIPQKFGIGLSVKKGSGFRAGFDYERKNWANINFSDANYDTKDSDRFSVGVEYSPRNKQNDTWVNRLLYRFGANYNNSYLTVDNTQINSFGVNLGVGIPFDGFNINCSIEYGNEGTFSKGLIKNSYWLLYMNISLNEFWYSRIQY